MNRQDRQGARTVSDFEQKYQFSKRFAEIMGVATDARNLALKAQKSYEGLSHEQIFNLLTNNGELEGLYEENGQVYINASYIKSGEINADLIKTGTINADLIKSGTINADLIKTGTLAAEHIDIAGILAAKIFIVDLAKVTGILAAEHIDAENLTVNVANIEGTLTAEQIDASDLKVKAANVTGTLTAEQIDAANLKVKAANIEDKITAEQINAKGMKAEQVDVSGKITADVNSSFGNWTIYEDALRGVSPDNPNHYIEIGTQGIKWVGATQGGSAMKQCTWEELFSRLGF